MSSGGPPSCPMMVRSVWYKFKPSTQRIVTFDTLGSNIDSIVNVWRGTSISNLTRIGCSDDFLGSSQSSVSWTALANRTYYIQVGGYHGGGGSGDLEVNFIRGS